MYATTSVLKDSEKIRAPSGYRTHDLRIAGPMLYHWAMEGSSGSRSMILLYSWAHSGRTLFDNPSGLNGTEIPFINTNIVNI